ncbi:MAG TPA: hypothetical protein VJL57_03725 [Candidatus Paceibacterota bacterium]
MADVQYQEPQYGGRPRSFAPKRGWLTKFVIKTGLAKDDAGAQKVLLILGIVMIVIAVGVWKFSGSSPLPPITDPGM